MRRVRRARLWIYGPVLALLAVGCNSDKTTTTGPADRIPPAQVTDLHVVADSTTANSLTLAWTASGNDGDVGAASTYDIRYSTRPGVAWSGLLTVPGSPAAKSPPAQLSYKVTRLSAGTVYYFSLKAGDGAGNWSDRSNDASGTTGRRQVTLSGLGLIEIHVSPPGVQFVMGSLSDERGRVTDEDTVQVTLTHSYFVCDHEVTQAEWSAVMGWNESSTVASDNPVDYLSWWDAIDFCNRLSRQDGLTPVYTMSVTARNGVHIASGRDDIAWDRMADGYRLLTEAEWEYACRAGATTAFSNGDLTHIACDTLDLALNAEGWYCGNSFNTSRPVRLKHPNALGLYDMHGNVAEWCWDRYASTYGDRPLTDPTGAAPAPSATDRVLRGGSFFLGAQVCRSASRLHASTGSTYAGYGLRIGRTVTQ